LPSATRFRAISVKAVKMYAASMYRKLAVSSRDEAAVRAGYAGLL
jgi:DNA-binding CsgD family transcriptional regulator